MSQAPKRLASIGECMLELCHHNDDLFSLDYAGDVYNMAVYCAHSSGESAVIDFISAVGTDPYSKNMLAAMEQNQVHTGQVRRIESRMAGLYFVENDEQGERDFHYYRSQSAARHMFDGVDGDRLLESLKSYDVIYFSGITLAILEPESRDKFVTSLAGLHQQGVTIAFDSNYRAKLWDNPDQAKACYQSVLPFVHIALPSLSDEERLYGDDCDACVARYLHVGAETVIVKQGERGYLIASQEAQCFYEVNKVKPVDTTGAGDSFNGAFLAALMQGDDCEMAAYKAAQLAATVVQKKGAIIV